jgi:para-nitrobenzyl esterase
LFRGAIIDSGVRAGAGLPPLARSEETGTAWSKTSNADGIAALRNLPTDTLVPASRDPRLGPAADGALIPANDDPAIPAVDVPIMTGWNGGEGAGSGPQTLTAADYPQRVAAIGANAALYPAGNDPVAALRAAGHDSTMLSAAAWARARAAHAKSPVYLFDFDHVMPGYTAADWGAYHSSELPYIFGTLDRLAGRPLNAVDNQVERVLQGYWLNFINYGDPDGPPGQTDRIGNPIKWRAFDPAHDNVMALSDAPHMRPITSPEKTALWRGRERP